MTSKIAGEPHTPRESWDPNHQICFAAWLTSTGPMHLRSTNGYHLRSTSRFAPVIRTRTIARILSISAVRRPCVVRAFRMRSNPSDVRGPVLAPPCILHFPQAIAGALQGMPVLVRAPHRGDVCNLSERCRNKARSAPLIASTTAPGWSPPCRLGTDLRALRRPNRQRNRDRGGRQRLARLRACRTSVAVEGLLARDDGDARRLRRLAGQARLFTSEPISHPE